MIEINGTYVFRANLERVWDSLNDRELLVRITPGLQELKHDGCGSHRALFKIAIGPINGTFKGTVGLSIRMMMKSLDLLIDVKGEVGGVDLNARISLDNLNSKQTQVVFEATASFSGILVRIGQRVLKGVARSITRQFFEALELEVTAD